jgi:hypothetical protein
VARFLFYLTFNPHHSNMKKLFCCFILAISLASCKRDTSELLVGRWDFSSLEMPGMPDFLYEIKKTGDDKAVTFKKFLLGDKLILRKDSTFDLVMLKQYIHGSWKYDKESKNLFLKDVSANKLNMTVRVDSVSALRLIFDIDEFSLNKIVNLHAADNNYYDLLQNKSYCQFYLDINRDNYSDLKDDPYSIENNKWRVKPFEQESDKQIKERVFNHLNFWQNLFADAQEKNRSYVAYSWFDSPLVVAENGVKLEFYDEHKKEWDQNFYDSTDANKGYQMMRKCFSKKLKFKQTEDKYNRHEDVIKQLKANYTEALKN